MRMRRIMRMRVPLPRCMVMIVVVRAVMSVIVHMGVVMPMRVDVLMSCFSFRSHRHLS